MKKFIAVSATVVIVSGCASIINEKQQQVNVQTSNGLKVSGTVNGQSFNAPGVVALVRENKNKVFITDSAGCKSETVAEKTVDPIFFINFISGGPLGSTTDYSTEKMWKYADNVTLNCK
jgi:hypothetical protein